MCLIFPLPTALEHHSRTKGASSAARARAFASTSTKEHRKHPRVFSRGANDKAKKKTVRSARRPTTTYARVLDCVPRPAAQDSRQQVVHVAGVEPLAVFLHPCDVKTKKTYLARGRTRIIYGCYSTATHITCASSNGGKDTFLRPVRRRRLC